jgi:hypothetical protein
MIGDSASKLDPTPSRGVFKASLLYPPSKTPDSRVRLPTAAADRTTRERPDMAQLSRSADVRNQAHTAHYSSARIIR